eukprot:6513609-Pyramimonas_sp.AAC.1
MRGRQRRANGTVARGRDPWNRASTRTHGLTAARARTAAASLRAPAPAAHSGPLGAIFRILDALMGPAAQP